MQYLYQHQVMMETTTDVYLTARSRTKTEL